MAVLSWGQSNADSGLHSKALAYVVSSPQRKSLSSKRPKLGHKTKPPTTWKQALPLQATWGSGRGKGRGGEGEGMREVGGEGEGKRAHPSPIPSHVGQDSY